MTLHHPPLDDFGRAYLALALEIDKHIPGYVDAYIGPPALKQRVERTPATPPARLRTAVADLVAAIPDADPDRAAYLAATLRAMDTSLRLVEGEDIPYLEEVWLLYDVKPQLTAETHFTGAAAQLDDVLPGQGRVAERLHAFRRQFHLPVDNVLSLLELARAETKRRTAAFVDLSADRGVEVTLTNDQPWGAYNWFLGDGRSHIEFNTDMPVSALRLLNTFAHEGYPGHHTEAVLKEAGLYRQKGYAEQAAMILHSPAAVIAEAIATTAVDIIFPNEGDDDAFAWTANVLLPAAGLPATSADQLRRYQRATRALRTVTANAAILYHTGQLDREGVADYLVEHALTTPKRAAKSIDFFTHPLFRSYGFTYTEGYRLLAHRDPVTRQARFFRALTSQVLPSQLAEDR